MNTKFAALIFSVLFIISCSGVKSTESTTPNSPPKSEHFTPLVGFRGITWGANPAEIQGFILDKTDKYGSYYSRENEHLQIGKAELYSITYKAYNHKFYAVFFDFSREQSYQLLADKFTDEFGEAWGSVKDKKKKELSWELHDSKANDSKPLVRIILRYDNNTQRGDAAFIYNSLTPPMSLYFITESPSNQNNSPVAASHNCGPTSEIKLRIFHSMYEDKVSAENRYSNIISNINVPKLDQLMTAARSETIDVATKENGGDLGYIRIGEFDKGFEASVFNLPLKELSQPIKSIFGWHLVWVNEAINTKTNMHCPT